LAAFLQQETYAGLFSLFQKARGESENEKLENMFKEIEQEDDKRIRIMSIHKSKGLGADHVFMVGVNEGILPNKTKGNDSLESQRRLFFVGMTRTKKSLTLISNLRIEGRHVNRVNKADFKFDRKSRLWVGKSSTFISELKLV
jgi:superfamily I DNA/RNA helicase